MADMLELRDVRAGYGDAVVLDGISLAVGEKRSLAILGRNGVGKSTLLLTIMGYTRLHRGAVSWKGQDISRLPPHRRARLGIGWVAQEREIFPSLNVEENLCVAARAGAWTLERVRLVPAPEGAARQFGQPALGRRAADARHRPRPDDEPGAPAPG